MSDKKESRPKTDKADKKKKKIYVAPLLIIGGSLLAGTPTVGAIGFVSCCLSQRLRQARRDPAARHALVGELAAATARG